MTEQLERQSQPRIEWIIVGYKHHEELKDFLVRLSALESIDQCQMTLVLNPADSDPPDLAHKFHSILAERFKSFRVICPPQNIGYFGAAQLALDSSPTKDASYRIISNFDLFFTSNDFIAQLLAQPAADDVGLLAPVITTDAHLGARNWKRPMLKRPSDAAARRRERMFRNPFLFRLFRRLHQTKTRFQGWLSGAALPKAPIPVYSAAGALMIFTRAYFENGADFRHPGFLWQEEWHVGEQLREAQLKGILVPTLQVETTCGVTTSKVPARQASAWWAASTTGILDKYYRKPDDTPSDRSLPHL